MKKRVAALAPYESPWRNVELVKDCGLIPYLLYKNHGCEVRMVGAKGEDYSYQSLISGVTMEFLRDGKVETKVSYIREHAAEIDLLILRGCHVTNFEPAYAYRQERPDGKIYVGLDANSFWMDGLDWENAYFQRFMNCCDVIAASGRQMQDYLNSKWPWKIAYVPNGYYSFGQDQKRLPFAQRENVILTVGRLGTQQKATHIMLEAFALAAERIPGWRLRLVGTIEPEFQEYIDAYMARSPKLCGRVEFVGPIQERAALLDEYRRARIFTLSSEIEGGTPNVVAEALNAGCVMAVTRFDACMEATDNERCGRVADIDDSEALAEVYVELATAENLEALSEHSYVYGRTGLDMENIVDKLYERLFGGCDE